MPSAYDTSVTNIGFVRVVLSKLKTINKEVLLMKKILLIALSASLLTVVSCSNKDKKDDVVADSQVQSQSSDTVQDSTVAPQSDVNLGRSSSGLGR